MFRPKLFIGQTGVGKTFLIEEECKKNGLYLIEYNASDVNTDQKLLANHIKSGNGDKISYLIDEVDCLEGKEHIDNISKFLERAHKKHMPVFLTAVSADRIAGKILKQCKIVYVYPKMTEEIEQILKKIFCDISQNISLDESIKYAAEMCNGDIRKAIRLVKDSNSSIYNYEDEFDSYKAMKLILYEKDRRKVYEYIRQIPSSSIYSWLNTTFTYNKSQKFLKILQEVDKTLHRQSETYMYSFIAFSIPVQSKKIAIRLPSYEKVDKLENGIFNKIKNNYGLGDRAAKRNFDLLKKIFDKRKPASVAIARKLNLNDREIEFLDIAKLGRVR